MCSMEHRFSSSFRKGDVHQNSRDIEVMLKTSELREENSKGRWEMPAMEVAKTCRQVASALGNWAGNLRISSPGCYVPCGLF